MSSDTVIRVENLSKRYVIKHASGSASGDGFRHAISDAVTSPFRALRAKLGKQKSESSDGSSSAFSSQLSALPSSPSSSEDFWALKDVSFEVKRGEVLGIIGRNGAGKSTLLKILSRITEPTSGRIGIKGRVASLLEVGTGFHAELTGRENIYLNGAILGMAQAEVRAKFDEIVAFAEVEQFLDMPVKRYSSGMYVRLAFAVAAHLDPDVLIVDEVLAVGDAEFQRKCLGKMQQLSEGTGRTVLFVSHNMAAVQALCDTALYLKRGQAVDHGAVAKVVFGYNSKSKDTSDSFHRLTRSIELTSVRLAEEHCFSREPVEFQIQVKLLERQRVRSLTPHVISEDGRRLGVLDFTENGFIDCELDKGVWNFRAKVQSMPLCPGAYHFGFYILADSGACDLYSILQFTVQPWRRRSLGASVPTEHRGCVEFPMHLAIERAERSGSAADHLPLS